MTYSEFTTAVIEELGVDGNRRGIEALRTRAIRDAVIDLQRFIRAFRQGHSTTFTADDLEVVSNANLGRLPDQSKPKAFYIVCRPGTGPAPVSGEVQSWEDLAKIVTAGLPVPQLLLWVESATGAFKITQLRAGTDATDVSSGIQRPLDFDQLYNAKVWYQA